MLLQIAGHAAENREKIESGELGVLFGKLAEMLAGKGADQLCDTLDAWFEEEIRARQALIGVPLTYRFQICDITLGPCDNENTNTGELNGDKRPLIPLIITCAALGA